MERTWGRIRHRWASRLIISLLLLCSSVTSAPAMERAWGYARQLSDPGTTISMATITVFYAGTGVIVPTALIFDDNQIPPTVKGNPFLSNTYGFWYFYAADGRYDVRISGGTPALTTYTLGDILLDSLGELVYNVREFGVVGNGVTDDTITIQVLANSIPSGGTIYFPGPGVYKVTAPMTLGSNLRLIMDPSASLLSTIAGVPNHTTPTGVFRIVGISNVTLDGIRATGLAGTYLVSMTKSHDITVKNCHVTTMNLFQAYMTNLYAAVAPADLSYNIRIRDNVLVGDATYDPNSGTSITIDYTRECDVSGNDISLLSSGIAFWGGNPMGPGDGAEVNERKNYNFTITNNHIRDCTSGIWGGMGRDFVVANNTVMNTTGEALDAEGSFNGVFRGNIVRNCGCGLTTYTLCKNIVFEGNLVEHGHGQTAFSFGNTVDFQDYGPIIVRNNTFINTDTKTTLSAITYGTDYLFEGNTFKNEQVVTYAANMGRFEFTHNTMVFDVDVVDPTYPYGVKIQGIQPTVHYDPGVARVAENTFINNGSDAYAAYLSTGVTDGARSVVAGNTFIGFSVASVSFRTYAADSVVIVADNVLGSSTLDLVGGTDVSTIVLINNYDPAGTLITRTHAGTPVAAVVPYFIGEELFDTVGKNWYKATGLTNADWKVMT